MLSSALEMLVAKLLTGQGQLPDVLQTVSGGLLHVLVLRADEPEEMCDHSRLVHGDTVPGVLPIYNYYVGGWTGGRLYFRKLMESSRCGPVNLQVL